MDPRVGMALDARPTDVYLDCCELARAYPLDCGTLRYVELLGVCIHCEATDFAWVEADFVGPTRRSNEHDDSYMPPTDEETEARQRARQQEARGRVRDFERRRRRQLEQLEQLARRP
jgi:hypothetical protein